MASYADERRAMTKAMLAQSRRRSREMELRVAKFLLGHRVPMSGAGTIKGDCTVVTDKVGQVFIECKYSAGHTKSGIPVIALDLRWLVKMHTDSVSMRAKFPALIFRYHGGRLSDYVIVPLDAYTRYGEQEFLTDAPELDFGDKTMTKLKQTLLEQLLSASTHRVIHLKTKVGPYIIMDLVDFKDIIHGPKEGIDGYEYAQAGDKKSNRAGAAEV